MTETLTTDYLIVGAGASGMSFADRLLNASEAELLLVDERHAPGGHWLDAYPFVRLHQPSAYYGVDSRPLGQDRVDTVGRNAGFYERASGAELCDYYERVLNEQMLPTGRVQFLGSHRYLGQEDGSHIVEAALSGSRKRIKVRKRLVDATYVQSRIPSRTRPSFEIDDGVTLLTPNELVHCQNTGAGFTVIGAGKTAMDTICWLLDNGVDCSAICWVRPREGWYVDRTFSQPNELAGAMARMQAETIRVAAEATSALDYARRMEDEGMFLRIDPAQDGPVYRGATLAQNELASLRSISNVVRRGRVTRLTRARMQLTDDALPGNPDRVYVNCTAQGLSTSPPRSIFSEQQITIQFSTIGVAPWSAAILGQVEALDLPLEEKNQLCPPLPRNGEVSGQLHILAAGMPAEMLRRTVPELAEWMANSRLNPGRSITAMMDDPEVQQTMSLMMQNFHKAIENLNRLVAEGNP
ncbi:MAG: NAD(P)-binding protein [Pseudomonadota bacterium]